VDVRDAEATAARELATLPTRLAHVRAVAELADSIGQLLVPDEHLTLVSAAYLHDIGYAPQLAHTGFHALDGALWLREQGGEPRLANLVAHHTGAVHEARSRGLEQELAEFEREESLVADLLSWCDLNRGPQGEPTSVTERFLSVEQRYGADHAVSRALANAKLELLASCERVEGLLAQVK
jgi:putative nucleotidyltransferase with HDIG domain